ncbi:MAG: glycosyltransferase [Planctomycetota bacterium]|nr:glycosyltransferase [Planctomycetota bacterium]
MGSSPILSIVIPARNEEKLLPGALRSIEIALAFHHAHDLETTSSEVIVSDNLSTDRTAEIARAAGARVVKTDVRNIAHVRNRGAEAARGAFLIFVDADSALHRRSIHRVISLLRRPDIIGGSAPMSHDRRGPDLQALSLLMNALFRGFQSAFGAFMFCRKEDLDAIGGFDEGAEAGEELILSEALKRRGRERRQRFRILTECPFWTSMRKLDLHGRVGVIRVLLGLLLDRMARRPFTDHYRYWYPIE